MRDEKEEKKRRKLEAAEKLAVASITDNELKRKHAEEKRLREVEKRRQEDEAAKQFLSGDDDQGLMMFGDGGASGFSFTSSQTPSAKKKMLKKQMTFRADEFLEIDQGDVEGKDDHVLLKHAFFVRILEDTIVKGGLGNKLTVDEMHGNLRAVLIDDDEINDLFKVIMLEGADDDSVCRSPKQLSAMLDRIYEIACAGGKKLLKK